MSPASYRTAPPRAVRRNFLRRWLNYMPTLGVLQTVSPSSVSRRYPAPGVTRAKMEEEQGGRATVSETMKPMLLSYPLGLAGFVWPPYAVLDHWFADASWARAL